jgi:hypothetical protein
VTLERAIFLVLAPPLYVLFVWALPRWWRNERGLHTDTPPPSWIWSLAFWRALCRVWGALAIIFLIGIPVTIVTFFVSHGLVFDITSVIGAFVGIASVFVVPSIMLLNRPRFLLAPHHRALPGWIAERRGAPVPPVPEPEKPPRWHVASR